MKPALQRPPFRVMEEQGTRRLGNHPPLHLQIIDPPGHHQIDGQTVLQAGDEAQLALLNLAAGLEDAMKHQDVPAGATPMHPLLDLPNAGGDYIGEQQPVHPLVPPPPRAGPLRTGTPPKALGGRPSALGAVCPPPFTTIAPRLTSTHLEMCGVT